MKLPTLEKLRKLNRDSLENRWYRAEYPFDPLECNWCMSAHVQNLCHTSCREAHSQFTKEVKKAGIKGADRSVKSHLASFFRLRKKFDVLYRTKYFVRKADKG
jgi:hypothetical protein